MPPTEHVWTPQVTDPGVIVGWLRRHAPDDTWTQRALFVPNKNHFNARPEAVKAYGANGNIGTNKSPHVPPGGPVLAHAPDLQLLEYAMRAADDQVLGVTAWNDEETAGWAAGTKALNLANGERDPGVPVEIDEALNDLHHAGYNGYHNEGAFYKAKYQPPIEILFAAGYSYRFVAGYLLALGAPAGRLGDALRQIYK